MVNGTLYDVLGVSSSASPNEVRTAYRLLAMKCHPAHNRGFDATIQFTQLSRAYSVLSDTRHRADYDVLLRTPGFDHKDPRAQPSDVDAGRLFIQEMSAIASELVEAGYDENFIRQALAEEGCPAAIAAAVARGAAPALSVDEEQPTRAEPMSARQNDGSSQTQFTPTMTAVRRKSSWGKWAVGVLVFLFGSFVIVFVLSSNQAAEEAAAQAQAAHEAAKKAEEKAMDALKQAREAEDQAREARDRARDAESQSRSSFARPSAPADPYAYARREAAEIARIQRLGAECNALMAQMARRQQSSGGSTRSDSIRSGTQAMAQLPMAQRASQVCAQYNQALRERQIYEALRAQQR